MSLILVLTRLLVNQDRIVLMGSVSFQLVLAHTTAPQVLSVLKELAKIYFLIVLITLIVRMMACVSKEKNVSLEVVNTLHVLLDTPARMVIALETLARIVKTEFALMVSVIGSSVPEIWTVLYSITVHKKESVL